MNLVLIGIMGAGKTTIGKLLSKKLNYKYIDTDEYIEKQNNMTINEMFKISENHFREKEKEAIKSISKFDDTIISCGGGVVKNRENIKFLKRNGIIFYIDRPVEMILNNIDCSKRPLLKDNKNKLYDIFNERKDLYEKAADYHILNDGSEEECIAKILNVLKEKSVQRL